MQKGFSLIVIIVGIVIIAGLAGGGYYFVQQQKIKSINSFEECAKHYPVMESYPAQCNTPDGRHFVQELTDEEKKKLIPPTESTSSGNEATEWETYMNVKYGFTINYPASWNFSTDNYLNEIPDYIIFSIYETTIDASRLELYKNFQGGFCEGSNDTKKTTTKIDNITGQRIECALTIAINFQKSGNNFWLIAENITDQNRDSFNDMIDTFKFTSTPSPTTSQNQCGDGVCQEVVCAAIGCPVPETPQSCPQDCKSE